MITDTFENAEIYFPLNKNFKLVFDFLKNNDLTNFKCGRHELKGSEIYFNLQEYETKPAQKLEAHKKYIDIQVVIKGEEYMGFTNIENTSVNEEYSEENDVIFLNGNVDKILATNKNFLIFYPSDAHMPALAVNEPEPVKKAIFKILLK